MVKKYPWWKALMDYGLALIMVVLFLPLFVILVILTSIDTGFPGIFTQKRVGREGKLFVIYKFQTYHSHTSQKSSFGKWMRKTKLDELPQLFNILKGEMSFVGPRPDIPGYYDVLKDDDRLVLGLKPGLTSEAGIKYRNESKILENQPDPLKYNDEVLFPDKMKMNLEYYHQLSFKTDILILLKTFSILKG
ncbi:sugar transferase [Chryseobacterium geocarposphaerae]|uniref:Lipopolysaccharide/colanic/teichoic acid biosynthesis glycosyltransferase n=1 Tax=Chryseobacterium geocarposphaerae TaxID=1416776 RepID=A0A2M9CAF5_9FLAO|nr:sugar transferase [Chryseobacterium geocarposphaerae]PJJ67807.1 lipopolysaccharide/colanic/teichoic acid biosynthesis glycosyltransferase [Chryseobacterium geocarposphaerae]